MDVNVHNPTREDLLKQFGSVLDEDVILAIFNDYADEPLMAYVALEEIASTSAINRLALEDRKLPRPNTSTVDRPPLEFLKSIFPDLDVEELWDALIQCEDDVKKAVDMLILKEEHDSVAADQTSLSEDSDDPFESPNMETTRWEAFDGQGVYTHGKANDSAVSPQSEILPTHQPKSLNNELDTLCSMFPYVQHNTLQSLLSSVDNDIDKAITRLLDVPGLLPEQETKLLADRSIRACKIEFPMVETSLIMEILQSGEDIEVVRSQLRVIQESFWNHGRDAYSIALTRSRQTVGDKPNGHSQQRHSDGSNRSQFKPKYRPTRKSTSRSQALNYPKSNRTQEVRANNLVLNVARASATNTQDSNMHYATIASELHYMALEAGTDSKVLTLSKNNPMTIPTTLDLASDHSKPSQSWKHLRHEAEHFRELKHASYRQAAETYKRGGYFKAAAAYYSERGRELEAKRQEKNKEAASLIVQENEDKHRDDKMFTIDVHHLTGKEAIQHTLERLNVWYSRQDTSRKARVITGKGNNSAHGRMLLRGILEAAVKKAGWCTSRGENDGFFYVTGVSSQRKS